MAILYVFSISGADASTPAFPPSVFASSWWANWSTYLDTYAVGKFNSTAVIVFPNQTALDNYINEYKLTDSALIADLNSWKTAHGISYSTAYYALTDAGISPSPTPIIS